MQGGIVTADRLVTVSPGYAQEITTPEGGWGLEGLLASRVYALNGAPEMRSRECLVSCRYVQSGCLGTLGVLLTES